MTKGRAAPKPGKTGDVEAAKKILQAALSGEVPRTRKPTKTDGIKELQPLIEQCRADGYSWAEIATLLKDTGFGNKDTIRYAISDAKPKKKSVVKAAEMQPATTRETEANGAAQSEAGVAPDAEPIGKEQRSEHAAQRRATWTP
jgi:hypothetical protein